MWLDCTCKSAEQWLEADRPTIKPNSVNSNGYFLFDCFFSRNPCLPSSSSWLLSRDHCFFFLPPQFGAFPRSSLLAFLLSRCLFNPPAEFSQVTCGDYSARSEPLGRRTDSSTFTHQLSFGSVQKKVSGGFFSVWVMNGSVYPAQLRMWTCWLCWNELMVCV